LHSIKTNAKLITSGEEDLRALNILDQSQRPLEHKESTSHQSSPITHYLLPSTPHQCRRLMYLFTNRPSLIIM